MPERLAASLEGPPGAPVVVLGNSLGTTRELWEPQAAMLGGMIGMWLAAHAPERIDALALCCTSACLPPAQLWEDRASRVRAAGMASISGQVVGRWFTPRLRRA